MLTWYTKEFLIVSMTYCLREKGYKVQQQEAFLSGKKEVILLAAKWGNREIVEIKGYEEQSAGTLRQEMFQAAAGLEEGLHWFPRTLLSSLLSLARQYKNDHLPVSLCLPDLPRYREILGKVGVYFTDNNLHLKVYLVKEHGRVDELDLNERRKKQAVIEVAHSLPDLLKQELLKH